MTRQHLASTFCYATYSKYYISTVPVCSHFSSFQYYLNTDSSVCTLILRIKSTKSEKGEHEQVTIDAVKHHDISSTARLPPEAVCITINVLLQGASSGSGKPKVPDVTSNKPITMVIYAAFSVTSWERGSDQSRGEVKDLVVESVLNAKLSMLSCMLKPSNVIRCGSKVYCERLRITTRISRNIEKQGSGPITIIRQDYLLIIGGFDLVPSPLPSKVNDGWCDCI